MKINPNLSIEQALRKAGVRFVVTSGYRSPKRQRELGLTTKNSWHSQRRKDGSAWALDIIPDFKNGATWDTLRQELAQPALQEYFMANHMGALDETIPSVKKRTGATGNHFHIGKVRTDNGEGASVYMHWVNEFYPKNKMYTMGNPDFKYTPGKVSAGGSYTQGATSRSGQSQTYSPEDMESFVGALFNSPQESQDKKLPLVEVIASDGNTVATKEAEIQGGINNIIVNTKKMFADKKQPEPEFAQPLQTPQTPVLAEKQQEPSLMDNMYKTDLLTYFQNLDNQYAQEEEPISLFADNNQFRRGGKINKEANNKAMWEKGKHIYKRLISAGIKPIVAMGIVGNIALESGFDHNIVSKSGSFSGLTQNSKEIRKYIIDNYGGYTLDNQLQYILDGLNSSLNTSSSIGKQLQSRFNNYTKKMSGVKSPETAAALWESNYEKSGGQSLKARKDYARYFWDNIGDLNKHYKPVKSNGNSAYEPLIFNPTDINEEEIKRFIDTTTSKVAESYASTYPWEIKQPDFSTPSESMYYNPEPINYTTVPSLPQEVQQAPVGQDIINQMYNTSILDNLLVNNTMPFGGNLYSGGGYQDWVKRMESYKGIPMNNLSDYMYNDFYFSNPPRAWAMLGQDPRAHFTDEYKTVYHPTFSIDSRASGKYDPRYNPFGYIGGRWEDDTFYAPQFSPVSMDERINYLVNSEEQGARLKDYNGEPIWLDDGSIFGPILPNITVTSSTKKKKK